MSSIDTDVIAFYRGLRACVEAASPHDDLSARQLAIFLACSFQTGLRVKELHANLGIPKAAIVRALDKLCELKLLRRSTRRDDQRCIEVHNTANGMEFKRQIRARMASLREAEQILLPLPVTAQSAPAPAGLLAR